MKGLLFYSLAMGIVLMACNKPSNPYDTAMTVMVDETDTLPTYPTAQTLVSPFKLLDDPWQGIQISLMGIADKDVNAVITVSLEKEDRLTGNLTIRRAKVQRFITDLQNAVATFRAHKCPRSIIFRAIAEQASHLVNNAAHNRYLIVFSDLLENSEVSFYNPQTIALLKKSPATMEKQLEVNIQIPSLNGMQVWFLFAPSSYSQNSVYMPIARFYESVYRAHNAEVHVANQFDQP
jgi:hypothetical protein